MTWGLIRRDSFLPKGKQVYARVCNPRAMPELLLSSSQQQRQVLLNLADSRHLAILCGPLNTYIKQIEQRLGIRISHRGSEFRLQGDADAVVAGDQVLHEILSEIRRGETITPETMHLVLQEFSNRIRTAPELETPVPTERITAGKKSIRLRSLKQIRYVEAIRSSEINFCIGPAGTGKTYLAVACAVDALERRAVKRLLLVRPAVEAGEKLGFLPGDLTQKIDPYLRPLYDALYDMLDMKKIERLLERNVIEVAPLAYMRGRSLNESFIILDESQNTTVEQMKMFLTRIGFGSTAVVTGDISQVDLPRGTTSGLRHIMQVLAGVEGISFIHFGPGDVVRHPVVQRIVEAYEQYESRSD